MKMESTEPSKATAKGSRVAIIQGWMWYIMSMALDSPISDLCITI